MMLRTLLISSLTLTIAGGLSACSTVTDNIPTVKIERKKKTKRVETVETRQTVQQASYSAPKVQKAEAAMVCDNDNMRGRAADGNMKNDMARVLILEEGGRSSNIIADVEVNCRDYFQSQQSRTIRAVSTAPAYPVTQSAPAYTVTQAAPAYRVTQSAPMPAYTPQSRQTVIAAPAPAPIAVQRARPQMIKAATRVEPADGYYYSIKRGDTLYGIARENCSSVKDLSRLNGIADPTKIEIHQIIRLPAKKCNARK